MTKTDQVTPVSKRHEALRRTTSVLVLLESLGGFALLYFLSNFGRSMSRFDGESWSALPTFLAAAILLVLTALSVLLWRTGYASTVYFAITTVFALGHLFVALNLVASGGAVSFFIPIVVALLAAATAWNYRPRRTALIEIAPAVPHA